MKIRADVGLTFDDVLLAPKRSGIRSRSDVNTTSCLVPGINLAIPVISANMDTVTEARMAIAMAQAGGIGLLHRFMSLERQAEMVQRVKRSESFVVENPITILQEATLEEARNKMARAEVGGLVVTDEEGRLVGLLTTRDVLLAPENGSTVETLMTPRERIVTAPADAPLDAARIALHANRIEKLPLVDNEDRVVGLITAQDIIKIQEHPHATKDNKGHLRVGAAVGVRSSDLERAAACVEAGADLLVIDIAHGHSDNVIEMVGRLKRAFPGTPVIAGNVASAEGVRDLAEAGADAVKVGVGAGSICTTRIVTGFGVPQLSAVAECAQAGQTVGVPVIADGGIRTSGDLTKALAAGASTVMIGNLLAGTEESPGAAVVRGGRRFKVVRGMASLSANVSRKEIEKAGTGGAEKELDENDWEMIVPEGVEAVVPYRGEVKDILYQLVGGLRSGLSYAGARTIEELWERAEFVRITPAGKEESGAHDVVVL
jgi:IMP dehydrogenase